MAISSWHTDWFPLSGQAVFDRNKQHVAALARIPGSLDLFVIGFDNRVWSTFWTAAGGWHHDWFPLPGHALFNRDTQQVTAVSRTPGVIDLFVIGSDDRVRSTFWTDLQGWHDDWFVLPGTARFDHRTQQIAAVARTQGNLDLFALGPDNRAWSTYWTTAHGWNSDWFPLPGKALFNHASQQITAVSRTAGSMDLFALGGDNHAWATFWSSDTGWSRDWFPLPGQARFDHTMQRMTVVARAPDNLDLFVLGFDHRVWSTFWSAARGWRGDWFPLPGQSRFDYRKQHVTAVARAPDTLDLFMPGAANHGWSTFWSDTTGWNRDWFPLPGGDIFNGATQQLVPVARTQSHLDIFVIGLDNRIWSTFWGEHDAHPAIHLRAVTDQGRFVEIVGEGFTPHQAVKVGYDITAEGAPATHQLGEDTVASDAAGTFIDRIHVNLGGDISGAQARATDLASNEVATASI